MKKLFLILAAVFCVSNLNVAKGDAYAYAQWWTCTSRGRVDAGLYGTWDGYGPSRKHAYASALNQCKDIALGCHVYNCHPGL